MAITVNSRDDEVMGNMRVLVLSVSVTADNETYVTGYKNIWGALISTDNTTPAAATVAWSAGTLTFHTGGAEDITCVVFCN